MVVVSSVAQNNIINGKVVDNNNEPIIGVNLFIKNSKIGTQTDMDGNFTIKDVPSGDQTIVASFIGFKTKTLTVSVPSNSINITLFEGNELLQEVVVDTNRKNKFSRKKSAYVAKLPLKNIENSQVYSTVTNQLLISQSVTSFEDALKNTTGVEKLWSSTGRGGDGAGAYSLDEWWLHKDGYKSIQLALLVLLSETGINSRDLKNFLD